MKRICLVIIILCAAFAGCTDTQVEDMSRDDVTLSIPESKEKFSISYPEWKETESDDPYNNITLTNRQCSFALNIVDAPPQWYEIAVKEYIEDNDGTIISESPLSYTLTSGRYTFRTRTDSLFCNDKTYFAFFSCLQNRFDEKTSQEIFDSMYCEKEWETPHRTNRKLGLMVSPQNTTDIKSYYRAYNLARDNNVQMTHYYASWGDIEGNWTNNDFVLDTIGNKGLEVSVAFDIIHTSVIGNLPGDIEFNGWDDPVLISRFSDFVIEYIERYNDTVGYVEIGNEVDIYFNKHPGELGSYKIFYSRVYDNIKAARPDMKVGTVFAYHELKNNNNFEVYETLAPVGDFDAFTLYIYSPGFTFDRDPVEVYEHLQEIEELTKTRKFALEEVGWNAYKGLEGTEDDQQQAVTYFFDYLDESPERLEFMTWFLLHDGTEYNCRKSAQTFLEPDDPIIENDEFMGPFSDFICYLGLIESDGTPRAGWNEFTDRAHAYAG